MRLTIREASKQFNLSRMRIYDLLARGVIKGFRAGRSGRKAGSWVDFDSLSKHIENRDKKVGRPKIIGDDIYVPVHVGASKVGYSRDHVYRLIKQGYVAAKCPQGKTGILVHLEGLQDYKRSKHLKN